MKFNKNWLIFIKFSCFFHFVFFSTFSFLFFTDHLGYAVLACEPDEIERSTA